MNKIRILLLLLLIVLSTSAPSASVYYVSNSGDDSNNGISPVYPFKTIAKINEVIYLLKPGDAVLFERGGVFYGQINITAAGDEVSSIYFGAYGEGKNPVISGSVPVTNWTNHSGNVLKADVNGIVKNLFANGKQMTLARYPNSGYLYIDAVLSDPKKGFIDKELKQPDGYWKGSIARIRTINWAYEYSMLEDFSNSSVILASPPYYPVLPGWGYYLDNNLKELDTLNEWYFANNNDGGGILYLYPPAGDSRNINVQASVYDYGILSNKIIRNLRIQDLEFRNQSVSGIYIERKVSDLKIDNCTFGGQFQIGLNIVKKSVRIEVNNCRFYGINGRALNLSNVDSSLITRNIFLNTGMIPGYGTTRDPFVLSAAYVFGNTNVISGNYIDGAGHGGFHCPGAGNVVEKNVIKNCLQFLNDGGGIKAYGDYTKDCVWRNNFIFNVKGNFENTRGTGSVALGIYLDEFVNNVSILNNTIAGSRFSGIGLHDANNNLISGNVCYNNLTGINFFQNIHGFGNRVTDNIIKAKNDNQYFIDVKYLGGDYLPGSFDSNYYFSPGKNKSFSVTFNNVASDYSFEKWKEFVRSDADSKLYIGTGVTHSKLFTNMSDEELTIELNSGINYNDIYLGTVSGSISIDRWTSTVLFADRDISGLPELIIAGGPLNFGNTGEESLHYVNWYNVTGLNLNEPMVISAPVGFEISLNNDFDFGNTITLNPENGKVDKIIFVKFTGDNGGASGLITNKSGSLLSNVKVSLRAG